MASELPDRLLSHQEVAELLGVPQQTLYQWHSRGVGPRSYRVGRYRRYRQSDLEVWLEQRASDRTKADR